MADLIPANISSPKTLGEKQELFSYLLGLLILKAYALGFKVRMGDVLAKPGTHKENSNHYIKLAADLNLFLNNKYLDKTEDHKQLGDYWKSLHHLCRWGGDFSNPDGNHYSLLHIGRA